MLHHLAKPWFVWRPQQLARRVANYVSPIKPGFRPLRVAWGAKLLADPSKCIGYSILTTGVYDLGVTETLARIVRPGDTVVDAGANVGYMSVLASLAAGPSGRVHSFEPNPRLLGALRRNAEWAARSGGAPVEIHTCALGDTPGEAELVLPLESYQNDGMAKITGERREGAEVVTVPVRTIDGDFNGVTIDVMKLDVEEFELHVLHGARKTLEAGRIGQVVFEDYRGVASPVVQFLQSMGYHIFAIGWRLRGLVVEPLSSGTKLAAEYEAPNYLATREPRAAERLLSGWGWKALRSGFARRAARLRAKKQEVPGRG